MGSDDIWFTPKSKSSNGKSKLLIFFVIIIIILILVPFFSGNFEQEAGSILDTVFNVIKQLSLFFGIILLLIGFVKAMSSDGRAIGIVLLIVGFILILLWLDPINFIKKLMENFGGYEDKYRRESGNSFGFVEFGLLTIGTLMSIIGVFNLKNHKKIGIILLIIGILLIFIALLDPLGILGFIKSFFDGSSGFPYGYT